MINEFQEARDYADGKNIYKNKCTFRMCLLLIKYFLEAGFTPLESRENMFRWATNQGIHLEHNINDIIRMAIEENKPLCHDNVRISKQDIENIVHRFDNKNSRLCALGLLLYSKAHADEDGLFSFNQVDFANWIGIQQSRVSVIFDELELLDYIEKIYSSGEQTFMWNGRIVGKRIKYKIKVPYEQNGEYQIENNDIRKLYSDIFDNYVL